MSTKDKINKIMYQDNIKCDEVCEKEGNIYFDLISECKVGINKIGRSVSFVSSGGKLANAQNTPNRTELEAELISLLTMINELRDSIIK